MTSQTRRQLPHRSKVTLAPARGNGKGAFLRASRARISPPSPWDPSQTRSSFLGGLPAQDGGALDWRRYLCGGGPRGIIARLSQGDPLGLRRVVGVRLRQRALLLDADRVHLRALTRIALGAGTYSGLPRFDQWLEDHVDGATDELRKEAAYACAGSLGPQPTIPFDQGVHEAIGEPLGICPADSRRVCVAFNQLTRLERLSFMAVVLSGESAEALAEREGVSVVQVARRVRDSLERVLKSAHPQQPGR